MSTTFDVYPKTSKIPTFEAVTGLATSKLRAFLKEFGIEGDPEITVDLRQKQPEVQLLLDMQAPARWPEEAYAWFTVPPISGGTDAYFCRFDELDSEVWAVILERNEKLYSRKDLKELVEECLNTGYYWYFRRSAGQAAIIHLAYGLLASSFAELTEGFIYSDDAPWDRQTFPATAAEFDSWYFRPRLASNLDKEWAEKCIRRIPKDLALGPDAPNYSDEHQ